MNEELTYDFLYYLERRLGTDRRATAEMLGEWLASYEPQRPRTRSCPTVDANVDCKSLSA